MKLRAIRVSDVKGFGAPGRAIEGLGDGLNVLAAENEFGKSTLFEALRVVLYEKHSFRNARIESLRPYNAKGGPTVEIDLETETGCFRLHKRFLSRSAASVINLATGQAIASGDDVQDWVFEILGADKPDAGPTGLLWVEQGASLDQPRATKTSGALLSSLIEDTVSEVTGGAKVRSVLDRAESSLSTIVTAGRGQPTGRYRDVLKERTALLAEISNSEQCLQDAEQTRQELSRLQTELARSEDPKRVSEMQQALKAITEKWQGAQHISERVEGLTREVQLTKQDVLRLEKDLKDLEQALSQAAIHHTAEKEIAKKITDQEATLTELKQVLDTALSHEERYKQALLNAKAMVETVRKASKVRAAKVRLNEIMATLRTANVVKDAFVQAQARRDAIKVDRQALVRLDALRAKADRAEAHLKAGQAQVSVRYAKDSQNKVRIDGQVLEDNEQHSVAGRVVFDVDAVGRIVIDAGAREEETTAQKNAKSCADALHAALSALDIKSMAEAHDAIALKTKAEAEAKAAEAELHRIAPHGLQSLKDECAALSEHRDSQSAEVGPTLSEEEADANLQNAEAALEAGRKDRDAAENKLRAGEQVMSGYTRERDRLRHSLETLCKRLGEEETWDQQRADLAAALAERKAELARKTTEQTALQNQLAGHDAVRAEKQRLENEAALQRERILELNRQTSALVGALGESDKAGVGEKLAEAKEALVRQEAEIATLEAEKRALELLIATLKTAETNAQAQFFEPVMAELKPVLHHVMPESELKFGSDFSPAHIVRDGLEEPFAHLSGGTREQIAVLTRLAFARLMARKGRRMPVILDDALVYSDDDRIERMFKALQMAAADIQLIVLTCRQKTFQDLGGTKLQLVDWTQS